MPPQTYYCTHLECTRSTRTDKPAFRHWRPSGLAVFWPEEWGRREDEDKICRECYDEKLAIQTSLQCRPQTRQGPRIPDAPRASIKRGEAELLALTTPLPTETSAALVPDPAEHPEDIQLCSHEYNDDEIR